MYKNTLNKIHSGGINIQIFYLSKNNYTIVEIPLQVKVQYSFFSFSESTNVSKVKVKKGPIRQQNGCKYNTKCYFINSINM